MKAILMSLLVVALAGGITGGGLLAHFSDTEISEGNAFSTGSLDLKVDGKDDPEVTPFHFDNVLPCNDYVATINLTNVGSIDGIADLHITNVTCMEDATGAGVATTEPELLAEEGGIVCQHQVEGMGIDRCDMDQHTLCTIRYDGVEIIQATLNNLSCEYLILGSLPAGAEKTLTITLHLQAVEDMVWAGEPGANHWLTNAYQGDSVSFDIMFSLICGCEFSEFKNVAKVKGDWDNCRGCGPCSAASCLWWWAEHGYTDLKGGHANATQLADELKCDGYLKTSGAPGCLTDTANMLNGIKKYMEDKGVTGLETKMTGGDPLNPDPTKRIFVPLKKAIDLFKQCEDVIVLFVYEEFGQQKGHWMTLQDVRQAETNKLSFMDPSHGDYKEYTMEPPNILRFTTRTSLIATAYIAAIVWVSKTSE